MRRLLQFTLLLAALAWCPQARAWGALSQVKDATACSSPCTVTLTSTGLHNALWAAILNTASNGTVITAVTAADCNVAWVILANTAASVAGEGSWELAYCLDSASGKTTAAITAGNCSGACIGVIWEAPSTNGSIALDSGATPSGTHHDTTCSSCAGTALTLGGNNDFSVAIAGASGNVTGLTGTSWVNDLTNPGGFGVAHAFTSASMTAPATWTQASGTLDCSAGALQEAAGGASVIPINKQRRYEEIYE